MVYTQVRVVYGLHTGGVVYGLHTGEGGVWPTQVRVVYGLHTGGGGVWSTHR